MLVSVTSVSSPSPTVTDAGENTGAPQTTSPTSGRSVSVNVTTVPTGRSCGPSTAVPSARTVSVPASGPSWVNPAGSAADHATENSVAGGTLPARSPVTVFATEKPPTSASAWLVSATPATASPSPMVTVAGENTGSPHATPGTVGSGCRSTKRTTVPAGRSCGPASTVPSARTVSVPCVSPAYSAPSGSSAVQSTTNSVPPGTAPAAPPATVFWTANPPTSCTASAAFVSVTSTAAPSVTVTDGPGSNDGTPHTTPSIAGSGCCSASVTTVPTGRSAGPLASVPSARTVSVPVVGPS